MATDVNTVSVLFVCLGNICRSPTAQGVFERMARQAGLVGLHVDSCGTGGWHAGSAPDRRATRAAADRGYELAHLRARQLQPEDFNRFDYLLAMDKDNLRDMQRLKPSGCQSHMALFLDFAQGVEVREVPDPYYGDDGGFDQVLDLVEAASGGFIQWLQSGR